MSDKTRCYANNLQLIDKWFKVDATYFPWDGRRLNFCYRLSFFFCRYILKVNLIQIQNMQQLVKRERKRKRFFKPRMLFRFQRMVQRAPKISSSVFLIAYPVFFFHWLPISSLKKWVVPRQVQSKIILSKNPYCNLC